MGGFKLGKMTLGSLFKKPETVCYPAQRKETPAGLKGHIVNDVSVCIVCGICQRRCPCAAIVVEKPTRKWTIDKFRCVQCGTCVLECPKHCLHMEPGWPAPARKMSIETFDVPEHPKPQKKQAVEA